MLNLHKVRRGQVFSFTLTELILLILFILLLLLWLITNKKNDELNIYDLGYLIGPILNSGGRLGKSNYASELLSSDNPEIISNVTNKLVRLNNKRKNIESLIIDEIDLKKDYAISDGGFVDELIPVVEKVGTENFVLVQLTRDGEDYSSDSRRYFQGSRIQHEYVLGNKYTEIDRKYVLPQVFDVNMYRIHNNGSLQDFNNTLEKIYQSIKTLNLMETI